MILRLDPLSRDPAFEQIAFQVKRAVALGELMAGDRLPSVRELAKELVINPNTVSRSYELLEGEGVIVRRQGAGCFVTGATSSLSKAERRKRLQELLAKLTTEAHHLGFSEGELLAEIERSLKRMRVKRRAK